MKTDWLLLTVALVCLAGSTSGVAGWMDYLDKLKGAAGVQDTTAPGGRLTDAEITSGLKEALHKGTRFAVDTLGKPGGFLDNSKVRIPVPDSLSWVEKSLRALGQGKLADDFIATLNHAAEQAVPEAAAIFGTAIQQMTLEDARGILSGGDDAATQYFRRNTETALTQKMRPIVEQATARTGVTSAYKNMLSRAGGIGGMLSGDATDLDGYVTGKTLEGLFLMIAEEERKIRENPLARSTDLMKKVFGAYR